MKYPLKYPHASVYLVSPDMCRKISGLIKFIKTLYLASSVVATVSFSVSIKLSIVVLQCVNLFAFPDPEADVSRSNSSLSGLNTLSIIRG